jgi:hypothetical protein
VKGARDEEGIEERTKEEGGRRKEEGGRRKEEGDRSMRASGPLCAARFNLSPIS